MFCEQCGKQMNEGVAFCPNCGGKVNKGSQETTINSEQSSPVMTQQQEKPKKKKGPIVLIIVAVAILFTIFMLLTAYVIDSMLNKDYSEEYYEEKTELYEEDVLFDNKATYEKGIVTETTYESEFLGIRFTCPEGYIMDDSAYDPEMVAEMLDIDDKYEEALNSNVMEILVSSETGESNFNIVVGVQPIDFDVEKYADLLQEQINEMVSEDNMKIELGEIYTDILGDQLYEVIPTTTTMYGIELTQEMYYRQVGNYYMLMTFTGDCDILKEAIELY